MVIDKDIRQRLNLVRTNRSFVIQESGTSGEGNVMSPSLVPRDTGIYWIAGTTLTKSGRTVDSVFRIDSNSGGTLVSVFWWANGDWYQQDDSEALRALGMNKQEMFPFDWSLDVRVAGEAFHQ